MAAQQDHFVAVLVVTEVNYIGDPTQDSYNANRSKVVPLKVRLEPVERAKIVVTGQTIDDLARKLAAHVELLQEDQS